MALGFNAEMREDMGDAIIAFAGNAALLRIYDGTKPSLGAAITTQTKLAELVCGSPFGTSADGVVTLTIAADTSADASGTASWFRIVKADTTTHVMDGTVTATGGGGDLQLNSVAITATGSVTITGTPTLTIPNST